MPKIVHIDWTDDLLVKVGKSTDQHRVKVYDLSTGATRGTLHVYARRGADYGNYSTGLILFDLGGEATPLLRCNGPHRNLHWNKFPRRFEFPRLPHVHYITERGQREHAKNPDRHVDSFALLTTAYGSLEGAMKALAKRAHLIPAKPKLGLTRVRVLP